MNNKNFMKRAPRSPTPITLRSEYSIVLIDFIAILLMNEKVVG